MPTYRVPDVIEVPLDSLELPTEVPVDANLTEKPLADCTRKEVQAAVKAFSGLLRQSQSEIEASIRKQAQRDPSSRGSPARLPRAFRLHRLGASVG
jgi:hypothetical protein